MLDVDIVKVGEISFSRSMLSNLKIGGTDILKMFKVLPWQQLLPNVAPNLLRCRFCWDEDNLKVW